MFQNHIYTEKSIDLTIAQHFNFNDIYFIAENEKNYLVLCLHTFQMYLSHVEAV